MNDTNPIELVDDLKSVLRRYIATTLPISRRYPLLAARFAEELRAQDLVVGPFVEALPDFEKGAALTDLLVSKGGFLHDAMGKVANSSRNLHKHQQRALELSACQQKSLLVATGTGSGKTESFLYPIAHDLLSNPEPERPGVKALLIYPMNALANDQLYYRIAPLFGRDLLAHGITFGRYTGQVKAKVKRDDEENRLLGNSRLMDELGGPQRIPKNWYLTREEMLNDPPQVLITNYAMLEHLLLLPRNERLFSANALRFIVLDEIHTYRGAQATEVAYLLRKLKNRLGVTDSIRVFGTSASLAEGNDEVERVGNDELLKRFASGLFGEAVDEVVRGKRIVHERLRGEAAAGFSLTVAQWVAVGEVIKAWTAEPEVGQSSDCWNDYLALNDLSVPELQVDTDGDVGTRLIRSFSESREVRLVAHTLDAGSLKDRNFRALTDVVFGGVPQASTEAERHDALSAVIRLGMLARGKDGGFPLLPGRYHLAVNSIAGLSVLLSGDGEGWARLKVAKSHVDENGIYFPLLTCRKCGQPFVEAYEEEGRLGNRRSLDGDGKAMRRIFWLGKPAGHVKDEEDDDADGSAPDQPVYEKCWLDPVSGALGPSAGAIALYAVPTQQDEIERAQYVRKCPACGGTATGADAEVVTRMHPGNEALGSVVTQRVLEALPAAVIDNVNPRPSFGRKLLTFSDNRQDAAFFAPYFERTAADLALRSAIHHGLKDHPSSVTAPQLARLVYEHWRCDGQQPVVLNADGAPVDDSSDATRIVLGRIGVEFCTPGGRRNSLEALGLVEVTYDENKLRLLTQKLVAVLPEGLPGDPASVRALIHILLENIRRERALSSFHKVDMKDSSLWGNYSNHRSFDIEKGDKGTPFKWLPSANLKRHNRRTWYLEKQLGLPSEVATDFLRQFWELIVKPPLSLLERCNPGYGLNGDFIRFASADKASLYSCKSCGLLQQHVVMGKCVAFHCRGEVEQMSPEERAARWTTNHYLALYAELNHFTVRAREHTASLSTDVRERIEIDFADRKVNVLSCTTTMEMGVDLGDLEAVVNLNVPPGISNYQQRTGRAGRRAQAAPFCVTVARNTNYDQAVLRDFSSYLASSTSAPFINLANDELFFRHQQSILLSHYLRHRIKDSSINAPTVRHLTGDLYNADALRAFTDDLMQWLESSAGVAAIDEAAALVELLPADCRAVGAKAAVLRNRFVEALREFAQIVCDRCMIYTQKMEETKSADELSKAARWQRMRDDFLGQFLVTQLSRSGLIPTYSFPVHSLSLEVTGSDTQQGFAARDIAMTRDASLGISEYAPGAQVIANGRIWESAGLAHYPKAFMPTRYYSACRACFHVDIGETSDALPGECSNCRETENRDRRPFIEPHGFITSAAQHLGRDPGSTRVRAKPADEARLIAAPAPDAFEESDQSYLRTVLLRAKGGNSLPEGKLFISNRGASGLGYYRCDRCNFAKAVERVATGAVRPVQAGGKDVKLPHDDPISGRRCVNERIWRRGIDFVHQFQTDVRLLRFMAALPVPEQRDRADDPPRLRRFHERLARTVSESMRLATADLLNLHPGEVRSTYRLYNGSELEVVLYDGVPGGAGYCARLGGAETSIRDLIQRAVLRLGCIEDCESGCRTCLCDYANQRFWETFERKAAHTWLKDLIQPAVVVDGPGRFTRWASPSLAALAERIANYDNIHLVARSLVDSSCLDEACLNQLVDWMQAGKTLHVYLTNKLELRPKTETALKVYRRLYPFMQEGRLSLHEVPKEAGPDWTQLPRLFTSVEAGAVAVRQAFAVEPLTQSIVGSSAEIGVVDAALEVVLKTMVAGCTRHDNGVLFEGTRLEVHELRMGMPRHLTDIFGAVAGAMVKRIAITDPFCGARANQPGLEAFIKTFRKLVTAIARFEIVCKETTDRDGHVEFHLDVEVRLDKLLRDKGFDDRLVRVVPLRSAGKTFHDRQIDVVAIDAEGCETLHRYFLTGGVDYLMNENADTRVFHIQVAQ